MKRKMFWLLMVFGLVSLQAQYKETFAASYSKDMKPSQAVVSLNTIPVAGPEIIDGAVRVGKAADGKNARVVYTMKKPEEAAGLLGADSPFPMRQGKLSFSFRPVTWKLGDSGFNMLLEMTGPKRARLHVTYLLPSTTGKPSIQVGYGVPGGKTFGARKVPAIFPYVVLDTKREWHDVTFEWSPTAVILTVDGQVQKLPTSTLELPETGFYADTLTVGVYAAVNSLGQSDVRDLKISAEEIKKVEQSVKRPFMLVPPAEAPVIDGKIGDDEYRGALKTGGLLSLPKARYTGKKSVVYFSYDSKYFYFALKSTGHKRMPGIQHRVNDANVWEDDSVDFMLDPTADTPDFYHLIFNWANVIYDEHVVPGQSSTANRNWNSRGVKIATSADENVWQMEAAIPFETLGVTPEAGAEWAFNICETNSGEGMYTIINAHSGYLEQDKFGIVKFGQKGCPVFRLESIGALDMGSADIVTNAEKLELNCMRYDETAMTEFPVFGQVVQAKNGVSRFIGGQDFFGKNGNLYLNALIGNQLVYSAKYSYETIEAASIDNLRRIVGDGKKGDMLRVATSQSASPDAKLRFSLLDARGKEVKVFPPVPVTDRRQDSLLPLDGIAPGDYQLGMELVDGQGAVQKKAVARPLTVYPEKYPWTGNKLGISEDVPAPWIPLEVKVDSGRMEIKCWNRCYRFSGEELFPNSLQSGKNDYLTSAPLLTATDAGGQKIVARGKKWEIVEMNRRRVVLENTGTLGGLCGVTAAATIDYDGFIWFDLRFNNAAEIKLSGLTVDFVMPNKLAVLLNSGFRDLSDTGKIPEKWSKQLHGQFGPFWYGNEEGGLSFGMESDQYWHNSNPGKQVTLHRDKDGYHAVLNIIDQVAAVPAEVKYGFYVMPTPVRPAPQIMRTLRSNMVFSHNRDMLAGKGYPTNFSWWTATYTYQGYPAWRTTPEGIKDHADNYAWPITYQSYWHYDVLPSKSYRSAWYAAYSSIGRNAPEVIWQGEAWRAGEQDKLYGNALYTYQDDMIEVCKTDDYCDFYLWRFDKSRRENPKIDGIYFDLMMYPACGRADHNHGYDSEYGRKDTYAVREHRRFLDRIYTYLHQNGNDSPVLMHMSGATARIGGFSFSDYFLDGELWCDVLVRDHSYRNMKLAQMRAELLHNIYGQGFIYISQLFRILPFVPAQERSTWKAAPWAERHIAGMLMLHEVMPDRTSLFDVAYKIWLALDRFGLKENAVLAPYWKPEALGHDTNSDGENTAINIWRAEDGRELLLCFNNQDAPYDFTVKQCAGKTATDMESGEKIAVNGDVLTLQVPVRNFRLIELK